MPRMDASVSVYRGERSIGLKRGVRCTGWCRTLQVHGVAIGCLLGAGHSSALGDSAPTVWLSLPSEATDCQQEPQFRQRIERVLGGTSKGHPASNHGEPAKRGVAPALFISISPSGTLFTGALTLGSASATHYERKVNAASCRDVQDALMLSLEIYLDERANGAPPSERGQASAAAAQSSSTHGVRDRAAVGKTPPLRAGAIPATGEPRNPGSSVGEIRDSGAGLGEPSGHIAKQTLARVGSVLSLGALAGSHVLPNWSWGVALRSRLSIRRSLELVAEASFESAADIERGVERAADTAQPSDTTATQFSFSMSTVSAGLAWAPALTETWQFNVDLGPFLSMTHASATSNLAYSNHDYPAVGFAAGAGLLVWALEPLTVECRLGVRAPVVGGRYLDASGEEAWEQPAIGVLGGLYLGWGNRE